MTSFVSGKNTGTTDEQGLTRPIFDLFRAGYSFGLTVAQRAAGANMSVDVAVGGANVEDADRTYYGWTDAVENVVIVAADPTNPRKDAIVAYIDKAVSGATNNPGAFKFKAVAGTPAGSPSDPSAGTIQTSVGAGNPYTILARVNVAALAGSIVNANIDDLRTPSALAMPYLWGGASNTKGHLVPNIADDTLELLAAAQSPTNKTISGTTNKVRAGGASSSLRDAADVQMDVEDRFDKLSSQFDWIESGLIWSGDSYGASLAASMTTGFVVINGKRLTVSAVTARAFTATKDTYVDILDAGNGTGTVVYTEVANNAASPALAANSLRVAIIVSGANIASVGSVNQGQHDKVLPIASSIAYTVTDSLGNLICNRNPHPTLIGYRQIVASFTTTATPALTDVTGLNTTVIIPTGRKVRVSFGSQYMAMSGGAGSNLQSALNDATAAAQIGGSLASTAGASYGANYNCSAVHSPAAGARNYKVQAAQSAAGTLTVTASATLPAFILVELI